MVRTLRNLLRLAAIAFKLARHDALFPLTLAGLPAPLLAPFRLARSRRARGRPGQCLARAMQEMGPTFVKLGQLLSTRSDVLGEQVASDLAELQDHLPPFPGAEARAIVEEDLGAPVETLFRSFTDEAVAAASIAQVHRAETAEGERVAVKVLRPGVREAFARDLDMLFWLASLAEWLRPDLARLKLGEVVRTMADTVTLEMDLRFEAAAAAELSDNCAGDPDFRVPHIDWRRTSRRVLTLEWIDGIPVDEREALIAAGHDPDEILRKAATALFTQAFRDGFFHADLHPGNLFVAPSGSIVAIDFGIMGRLDRHTRHYLADMLSGFLTGDYRRAAEAHFRAGYVPADKSVDAFTQACRSIAEPILGQPLAQISIARLLGQLFAITRVFEMETQPQLLLLQKSMLVAEGVGRSLNPAVNMWELARPLMEEWMMANRGPEARVRQAASDAWHLLERLPATLERMDRALGQLEGGVRIEPESLRALTRGQTGRAMMWAAWTGVALLFVIALELVL